MEKSSFIKLGIAALALVAGGNTYAQLTEQTSMHVSGNYDITMVSSVGLQPAWVSNTNPVTVIRTITNDEMFGAGDDLSLNNRFDGSVPSKAAAQAFMPQPGAINYQVYADCDDDMSTFQSSAAFLDFGDNMGCAEIDHAYLYWTGTSGNTSYSAYPGTPTMKSFAGGAVGNINDYHNIKFKVPGMTDYVSLVESGVTIRDVAPKGDSYVCMADVTSLIAGRPGGLVWVANLQSGSEKGSGGARAGWSLIVIYHYPNCAQRTIRFWDQNGKKEGAGNGTSLNFKFDANEVPVGGNSISYMGFLGLDGEDTAPLILDQLSLKGTETQDAITASAKAVAEKNKIVFNGGNGNIDVQPFLTDQPAVHACNEKGVCGDAVYSGFVSSQTTTYSSENGLNGNQVTRLPNNVITLGYDAHHVKLPTGAMAKGATTATAKLPDEQNGNYMVEMAYMAIETQQAVLLMDKTSLESSAAPSGELTYQLSVKNVGTKATTGKSTVIDTLDLTLDFVEGSVKFLDKSGAEIAGTSTAVNVGQDENEILTFQVPEIAAGDGSKANDSIRIQFKVRVKGIDRTDIWAYGCNRQVKNKATLIYKNDAGNDVEIGSNTSGGCSALSTYFYTPIVDAALEESYLKSHHDTLDLSENKNAGKMPVIPELRSRLQVLLNNLGMTNVDVNLFTFYDAESGVELTDDSRFDLSLGSIDYLADADLGGGCVETFYINVKVAMEPAVYSEEVVEGSGIYGFTSYIGKSDGVLKMRVFNGTAPYTIKLYNSKGDSVYVAGTNQSDYTFIIENLDNDTYCAVVTDANGNSNKYCDFVVSDPEELTVSIVSSQDRQCKYTTVNLQSSVSGRDPNQVEYVWKENNQSVSTSKNYSNPYFQQSSTYKLYVCDGSGQVTAEKRIDAIATPHMNFLPTDTACVTFYLPTSYQSAYDAWKDHETYPDSIIGTYAAIEDSGDPDVYAGNLAMRYTDAEGNEVNRDQMGTGEIYAQIVAAGTCSSNIERTGVFVKTFEECYPILVSKFFSPDGNGQNDRFTIDGLDDPHYINESPHITVFNRYGKKVWEADRDEILKGWDGTSDGEGLSSADYWYEITFNDLKSQVGHFTLKRRKE